MKLIGLLLVLVGIGVVVMIGIAAPPSGARLAQSLEIKMRTIKVVWAEAYASSLSLPNNNAEANQVFGRSGYFGAQSDMGGIAEFNTIAGGVLEIILKSRDDEGQPYRAALIPRVDPNGRLDGFDCYSHNWKRVGGLYRDCTYRKDSRATVEADHQRRMAEFDARQQPHATRPSWRSPSRPDNLPDAETLRTLERESQERAEIERQQYLRKAEAEMAKAREELEAAQRKAYTRN